MYIVNNKKTNHLEIIGDLIVRSDECILCTCWIDQEGLDLIEPYILNRTSDKKVKIYSDGNKNHVSNDIKEKLKSNPVVEHWTTSSRKRLHSKVHYFSFGDDYVSIVGSANLTGRGMQKNEELSVKTSGEKASNAHKELISYLDKLKKKLIKST